MNAFPSQAYGGDEFWSVGGSSLTQTWHVHLEPQQKPNTQISEEIISVNTFWKSVHTHRPRGTRPSVTSWNMKLLVVAITEGLLRPADTPMTTFSRGDAFYMIYIFTIFNFAITSLKRLKSPSQTPAFPGLCIRAEICKNILRRKDSKQQLKKPLLTAPTSPKSSQVQSMNAWVKDILYIWKHTFRKASLRSMYRAHIHEDQAHCLQRVCENSEMAPPSCVEFFRPQRMRGWRVGEVAEKPWCDREEITRGSSRMAFPATWKQLECRKSKHKSSNTPHAEQRLW